jgi:hypothetical protein
MRQNIWEIDYDPAFGSTNEISYDVQDWQDGQGGKETEFDYGDWLPYLPEANMTVWPTNHWPQALPNGIDTNTQWNDLSASSATNTYTVGTAPQTQEHCDTLESWMDSYNFGTDTTRRTADAEMKLATGGPLGSKAMNLWCLTATARDVDTGLPIPPEQISIGSFGNLDTNGNLYVVLPDNDPPTVTPDVPGVDNYTFTVGGTEYHPHITANGMPLDPDNVIAGADFCVGQHIKFDIAGMPSHYNKDDLALWSLPGTFVNTNSDHNCDLFYDKNAALLTRHYSTDKTVSTFCWYVQDTNNATVSVTLYWRRYDNRTYGVGPLHTQNITGKFNVHRPTTGLASPYQPDGTPTVRAGGGLLALGNGRVNDMSFQHTITTDAYCAGQAGYVQVLDGDYTDPKNVNCIPVPINGPALDGAFGEFPADRQTTVPANASSNLLNSFYDGPYVVTWNGCAQEDLSFSTYLMFQPPGGIWVPLRKITWELHDEAANGATVNGAEHVIGPTDNETADFPKWTKKF